MALDPHKLHTNYMNKSDWRVKENSNNIDSFGAYQKYLVGEVNAGIWRAIYGERLFEAHNKGTIHIHDMSSGVCNYCFGGSLETLFTQGIRGVPNLADSLPAAHLTSAVNQISSQILGYASEVAGAVAYSSFNTFLAPFVRKDNVSDKELKQALQNLIFNLNQNTRFSSEPCFSNLTIDLAVPTPLKDKPIINNVVPGVYGDLEEEAQRVGAILLDILIKGDASGKPFTYPLITVNISKEADLATKLGSKALELSIKTGNPYFANFIQSSLSADDTFSMCPLTEDTKVLTKSRVTGAEKTMTIKALVKSLKAGADIQALTPTGWKNARPVEIAMTDVFRVTFSNGKSIDMGENHLHPVLNNRGNLVNLKAKELEVGMESPDRSYKYHQITGVDFIDADSVKGKSLYCLEVDCDSHLFVLSNNMFTHNCRLRLDKSAVVKKQGLFGGQPSTGSIGVVTLSLPYLAGLAMAGTEPAFDSFIKLVEAEVDVAEQILTIKRGVLNENFDRGFYPHLKANLPRGFATFFSTVGYVGMSEAFEILYERLYKGADGKKFAIDVIDALLRGASKAQEATGDLFNVEQSPAESACYSLARKYNKAFDTGYEYFTNSSNLHVDNTGNITETVAFYDKHHSKNTGGSVYHLFAEGHVLDVNNLRKVIGKIFSNSDIPYVSYTPTMYICDKCGLIESPVCSCGSFVEKYTRVTGYIRPVSRYNWGKQVEESERVYLDNKAFADFQERE